MNRNYYFNFIEERLNSWVSRVKSRAKNGLTEFNMHSEPFLRDFLNLLFDYSLRNLNETKKNAKAIDLIDNKNKIIIQVSSTATKQKIEETLSGVDPQLYKDYSFYFIAITEDVNNLKTKKFNNPNNIIFDPKNDIYDISLILNKIFNCSIEKLQDIYNLVKEELALDFDPIKFDSSITEIINILLKENWENFKEPPPVSSFVIQEKINYNDLMNIAVLIDDYKIFYKKLNEKYEEFDMMGINKSFEILQKLQTEYIKLDTSKKLNPVDIFFEIIYKIVNIVETSKNYSNISSEKLELYVLVIVVDAFIKCRIFKNPKEYKNDIAKQC